MAITLADIAKQSPQMAKAITDYQSGITNPLIQQRVQAASGSMSEELSGITPYALDPGKTYGYVNPYFTEGYSSSAKEGAVGYGGAKFGAGSGADARFDPGTFGSGLWSMGIDYKDKNAAEAAQKWYDKQPKAAREEIDSYWKNNKKSGNAAQDIMQAVDWRQQDVARKIQKENGFLDSTIGQIVSTLGQVALGAVPGIGPILSAGMGAITGGLQGGGLGAVLGGLGGYGSGQLGSSLATNGIQGTINNAVSGFSNLFGGGAAPISTPSLNAANVVQGVGGAVNAAANAVPGLSSGVGAASLAASLGPSAGSAAGLLPAGAGGISTAAGAGLGATVAQAAGQAGVSAATGGSVPTGGATAPTGTGAAPISTPSANPASTVAGVGGSALGGTSTVGSILGLLGGSGGLGTAGLNLLQGVLGQMNSGDLEKLAAQLQSRNNQFADLMPPKSYRDSILSNLDMIMNRPGQLMEQGPYKDYMDFAQRSVERKMAAQGYGGVGQSTNTADAVTRATMESMSGIVQRDREIATQQLHPFFGAATGAATNMINGAGIVAGNSANQAANTQNIITGAAGILKNIFDS